MISFSRFLLITFAGAGLGVTVFSILLPLPMFLSVFIGINIGLILASVKAMKQMNPDFTKNRREKDGLYVIGIIGIVGISAQVAPSMINGVPEELIFGIKALILTTGYTGAVLTLLRDEYYRYLDVQNRPEQKKDGA